AVIYRHTKLIHKNAPYRKGVISTVAVGGKRIGYVQFGFFPKFVVVGITGCAIGIIGYNPVAVLLHLRIVQVGVEMGVARQIQKGSGVVFRIDGLQNVVSDGSWRKW